MSVVSESSPGLRHKRFAAGRRIRSAIAVPIVLLCGGLGFVLGSAYPPEVLFSRGQVAAKKAPAAPSALTAAPTPVAPPQAPTEAGQTAAPAASAPTPAKESSSPARPTILNKTSPDPAPAPEEASPAQTAAPQKAVVDEVRPDSRALAVIGDRSSGRPEVKNSGQPEEENARSPGNIGKEITQVERKSTEKRRESRARRQHYTDPAPSPAPAQQKGIISQIPIVGPVVGLVLPF
jgi:hypothetical protein